MSLAIMWGLQLTVRVPRELWGIYGAGCILIFLTGALAGQFVQRIRTDVEGVEIDAL